MVKKEVYEAICDAKEYVAQVVDETNYPDHTLGEELLDLACKIRKTDYMRGTALAVVVWGGSWDDDACAFYMPATRDCCDMYRAIKKRRRSEMKLYVYNT